MGHQVLGQRAFQIESKLCTTAIPRRVQRLNLVVGYSPIQLFDIFALVSHINLAGGWRSMAGRKGDRDSEGKGDLELATSCIFWRFRGGMRKIYHHTHLLVDTDVKVIKHLWSSFGSHRNLAYLCLGIEWHHKVKCLNENFLKSIE